MKDYFAVKVDKKEYFEISNFMGAGKLSTVGILFETYEDARRHTGFGDEIVKIRLQEIESYKDGEIPNKEQK